MALDEAHKARLKAHMNRDHADSLSHYLRAYNGLSASAAASPELVDLTLDTLAIASASGTHIVPVTPPMKTLADARVVLVDMAQSAQAKLGLSDVRVAVYTPPEGLGIVSFVGVTQYLVSAATLALGLVAPGTRVWDLLDAWFPGGAEGYAWLVRAIFVPTVAIHVFETWWMIRGRLTQYRVESGSKLWWLWVGNTFLEGYPCMKRFDRLVEAERKRKQNEKH
ncbi:putative integral membrane protein [Biscogniauxia marginata]|nr:putative integral membrane protein [Biscogniauxia marginata]